MTLMQRLMKKRLKNPCPRCREREKQVYSTGNIGKYCRECRYEKQKESLKNPENRKRYNKRHREYMRKHRVKKDMAGEILKLKQDVQDIKGILLMVWDGFAGCGEPESKAIIQKWEVEFKREKRF